MIELFGGQGLVVGERAVELIGGDNHQNEQDEKSVNSFFAIYDVFAGDIIEDEE